MKKLCIEELCSSLFVLKEGVINLSGVNYPVYTINNNKMLSSIELSEFLMYNISEILKYYKEFKEEKNNEHESNSEGNMAK